MFNRVNLIAAVALISVALFAGLVVTACTAPPAPAAPVAAQQPSAPTGSLIASHKAGTEHTAKPKRLEVVVEMDLDEFSLNTPKGEKNPTFRIPAGKTVGIHLHNEGKVMHEFVIGRGGVKYEEVEGKKVPAGYEKTMFEEINADVFLYYGGDKVEVGEAKFAEIEIPVGVRDIWIRFKVPASLKGEWEIGCFAEGHYEAGMKAKFVVE